MPNAPYVPREPCVWVERYGSAYMLKCAECGEVQQFTGWNEALAERWPHKREIHPTEDEQLADRIKSLEYSDDALDESY